MNDSGSSSTDAPLLWVPDPKSRGTIGIFSLCLSTMVISVWSAVHFDIPTTRQGILRSFTTSVLWMLAALFSPELLLFIAFNQRGNASGVAEHAAKYLPCKESAEKPRGFFRNVCALGRGSQENVAEKDPGSAEDSADNAKPLRRHPFTMVHGFYASMGGFVFDVTSEDDGPAKPAFLPANRTRMTLTSMGVRFLMEHHPDLIPDISETSITDRTRASSLSKAILLAQLTWFCTNCVVRLGQGLPLSLLEVTTVAHGLCTVITYLLWWNKPLNVAEPTLIRGEEAREACALMTMCSPDVKHMLFGTVSIQFPAEMASVVTFETGQTTNSSGPSASIITATASQEQASSTDDLLEPKPVYALTPEVDIVQGTTFTPRREECKTPYHNLRVSVLYDSHSMPWFTKRRQLGEPVDLSPVDINRWRLAYSALRRYGLKRETLEHLEKPLVSPRSTLQSSSDFKGRGVKAIARSNVSAMSLTLIYGLPHFLGWNARFPTPLEQRLWRIATVAVTLWGTGMASVVALIVIIRLLMRDFTGERRGEAALVACAAFPYIITAGYLLVESLRQLLYLEPAAYALPAWSNYWPHFS